MNPFLRVDAPVLAAAVPAPGAPRRTSSPDERFVALRAIRDGF